MIVLRRQKNTLITQQFIDLFTFLFINFLFAITVTWCPV